MTGSVFATLSRRIESAIGNADAKQLRLATWSMLFLGVLIRVAHFAGGRSLWRDEAALATNLARSTYDLGGMLGDEQMAPYGFLAVSKFLFDWLDKSDLALRLVPFVASLAALFLFYRLARRLLDGFGALVAVALMALAPQLVFYAAEFKPYEVDVLGAVLVLVAAERYHRAPSAEALTLLAVAGCVSVWCSFPMPFVLGAVGSVLFVDAARARQPSRAIAIAAVSAAWLVSFGLEYRLIMDSDSANLAYMTDYWSREFVTVFPTSIDDLSTLRSALLQFLVDGVGFYYFKCAIVVCVMGLVVLWRRRVAWAWFLLLPAVIMAMASTLHLYPPVPRLLLFLFPACFLLVPAGISFVRSRPLAYRNTIAATLALLFIWPMIRALAPALGAQPPFAREELGPVLRQVAEHAAPEDRFYVYYGAEYAYRWYASRFGLASHPTLIGRSPRQGWDFYIADAAELGGCGRTWLVFSHVTNDVGMDEERFLLFLADKLGRRVETLSATGSSAYLYEFSGKPAATSPLKLATVPEESLPPYGWSAELRNQKTHSWSCTEPGAVTLGDAGRVEDITIAGRSNQ